MILIKLNEILEREDKSLYWLSANSGVSYVSLWKLSKKETQKSINLDMLSRVCSALNCAVQEILVYVEDEEDSAIKNLVKSKERKERKE
jgi:DNA-binding Xre family transcriptional regulator